MRPLNAPKFLLPSDPQLGEIEPCLPPNTIERQERLNDKKVRMQFNYEPQMSTKHLEGPDSGTHKFVPAGDSNEHNGDMDEETSGKGLDGSIPKGGIGMAKSSGIKHRSVRGASGGNFPSGA